MQKASSGFNVNRSATCLSVSNHRELVLLCDHRELDLTHKDQNHCPIVTNFRINESLEDEESKTKPYFSDGINERTFGWIGHTIRRHTNNIRPTDPKVEPSSKQKTREAKDSLDEVGG